MHTTAAQSFVSRNEAFTTSYLLATVGAALSGSAKGDPRCTMCVSLAGTLVRRLRDVHRGWLVSVFSASKAKDHPHQLENSNHTSSSCTSHPEVHLSTQVPAIVFYRRSQVLRIATSLWPSTDNQEFRSPAGPHAGPCL